MLYRLFVILVLAGLAGCAKPPDLPEITVRATTGGELADFRTELGARFPAEQLQPFDTAVQELKLDAMDRDVATAGEREQDMLAAINGKSVRDALILGWRARRHRLLGQIALMNGIVENNLKLQRETAATGTPEGVITHLQNARNFIAQFQQNLADTERHLAGWGATTDAATPPKTK